MLVIIGKGIATNALRTGDKAAISERAGVFELAIRITARGTGLKNKSKRWAADLSQAQVLEILTERPDVHLRIDTLVEAEWHTCETHPGKFYHLE